MGGRGSRAKTLETICYCSPTMMGGGIRIRFVRFRENKENRGEELKIPSLVLLEEETREHAWWFNYEAF